MSDDPFASVRAAASRLSALREEHDNLLDKLARLRELPDEWEDASSHYYYENRHTHPYGIDYAAGFADGWDHAARLLREALEDSNE